MKEVLTGAALAVMMAACPAMAQAPLDNRDYEHDYAPPAGFTDEVPDDGSLSANNGAGTGESGADLAVPGDYGYVEPDDEGENVPFE